MQKKILNTKRIAVLISLLCMMMFLTSCTAAKMREYYSQRDNYITATGTVSHIAYNEDETALYIWFSEITPKLDDNSFKIVGDNLQIVHEAGIVDKIKEGDTVSFVTAPRYFGDGYVMPIVAISTSEEEFLMFDEGMENLLKWLD